MGGGPPVLVEVLGEDLRGLGGQQLGHGPQHLLHHRQVLQILVGGKQRITWGQSSARSGSRQRAAFASPDTTLKPVLPHTCDELNHDAADTPHVAGVGPAQAQDDLWCPVVPSGNDVAVILLLERCTAKVDHFDRAGAGD